MTLTYDPHHELYGDEADVRLELARVFDQCGSCRRCVALCEAFPTLFDMLDALGDHDAGRMTPAQQDDVVDACVQCSLCSVTCPYTPARGHDLAIDFPRLMQRATAMRAGGDATSLRLRATAAFLGRPDAVGRVAARTSTVANRVVTAAPLSWPRKLLAALTGVSARRRLSPFTSQRFTDWFGRRPRVRLGSPQGRVTVFPTCVVEYRAPEIGADLVKVYERNGFVCDVSNAGCCGAPALHAGDTDRFGATARRNVEALAEAVRDGTEVVVAQPTCVSVLKRAYLDHVPVGDDRREDAELVAAHTYDASEFLMRLHQLDDVVLDTDFDGDLVHALTYQLPSHLRGTRWAYASRDLMQLTGARVRMIGQSPGVPSIWALRRDADDVVSAIGRQLGADVTAAANDVVVGDCHLTNTLIAESTDSMPRHPMQVLARAYGIPEEP